MVCSVIIYHYAFTHPKLTVQQFMSLGVFTVLTVLPIGFEVAKGSRLLGDFMAISVTLVRRNDFFVLLLH